MPPQPQPPRPEHRAPQGRPAPGPGLGSTADNPARGPGARALPWPRAPSIKTFWLRAPGPPAAPLSPLRISSSLGVLWAPLASLGLGLEIPVTSLACHRRNRDPGDSRRLVCSAGLSQTRSARPSVCHSLSPAASLANEKSGWRHDSQFLAQGAGRKVGGGSWRAEDQ